MPGKTKKTKGATNVASAKRGGTINTIEDELDYMNKLWGKLDVAEKMVSITFLFLFVYLLVVVIASYDSLTKSINPGIGRGIFYLGLLTLIITFSPVILHYVGVSTFGVLHLIGIVGAITFISMLWLILETYEKRELETDSYKDPYSISVYFLLISFTVMYFVASISSKV